jgi:hypothetical protein
MRTIAAFTFTLLSTLSGTWASEAEVIEEPDTSARTTFAISIIREYSGTKPDVIYLSYVATRHITNLSPRALERQISNWSELEEYFKDIVDKNLSKGVQALERVALHVLYDYRTSSYFSTEGELYTKYKEDFAKLKARADCSELDEQELPEVIDDPKAKPKKKAAVERVLASDVSKKKDAGKKVEEPSDTHSVYRLRDGRSIRVVSVSKNSDDDWELHDIAQRTIRIKSTDVLTVDEE